MNPQLTEAWTLFLGGAAAGILLVWGVRVAWRGVRTRVGHLLPPSGTDAGSVERRHADLVERNERLQKEHDALQDRRRALADMNEMLRQQKLESEERAQDLARANMDLERMGELTAWQQEELAERNEALERQTAEAERLSRELSRRVTELNDALSQIERLHRDHESFLRHELRNAISPILGYVSLLQAQALPGDRTARWIGGIRDSAEATERLLNELKDLQEIERGARPLSVEPLSLDELVAAAVRAVDPTGAAPVEMHLEPCTVLGDRTLLPGAFVNLVKNAVEHVAGAADATVRIETHRDMNLVVTRVRNGGDPVPPERLARFFDRFNSTKDGGTGLGTSYVFLVVRAHGGTVTAESTQAGGTTVTVRLPGASGA